MNEIVRTAEQIALEINVIKEHAKTVIFKDSMEIGKKLQEAKQLVAHGKWGEWLQENVAYSERTAQNLMNVYAEYGLKGNLETFAGLTYSKAVSLLALPLGEREEFVEENDVESMSTRELDDALKELAEEKKKNEAKQLTIENLTIDLEKAKDKAGKTAELEDKLKKQKKVAEDAIKEAFDAQDKAKDLERKLEEAQTPEVVEKVPDGIMKELEQLRGMAKRAPNEAVVKFRTVYEQWQIQLNSLTALLDEIKKEDAETAGKYRAALRTACERVAEQMK